MHNRPAVRVPRAYAAFTVRAGHDIDVEVVEGDVPVPPGPPVFESGGTWRAYEVGRKVLYVFRRPMGKGAPARGLLVDAKRRRGLLYLAPTPYVRSTGFALSFPLDELLFQHHFAHAGAFVLHGCGIDTGAGLVAFCGHSGAGKTTTSRLWRRHAPGSVVLSDDRLVVRRRGARYWAFGTPWHGSGRYASPRGMPLRALFILKQARKKTSLRRLDPSGLASRLLAFTFPPPWEGPGLLAVLRSCERLAAAVPCYELSFRNDRSAVDVVQRLIAAGPERKRPSARPGPRAGA